MTRVRVFQKKDKDSVDKKGKCTTSSNKIQEVHYEQEVGGHDVLDERSLEERKRVNDSIQILGSEVQTVHCTKDREDVNLSASVSHEVDVEKKDDINCDASTSREIQFVQSIEKRKNTNFNAATSDEVHDMQSAQEEKRVNVNASVQDVCPIDIEKKKDTKYNVSLSNENQAEDVQFIEERKNTNWRKSVIHEVQNWLHIEGKENKSGQTKSTSSMNTFQDFANPSIEDDNRLFNKKKKYPRDDSDVGIPLKYRKVQDDSSFDRAVLGLLGISTQLPQRKLHTSSSCVNPIKLEVENESTDEVEYYGGSENSSEHDINRVKTNELTTAEEDKNGKKFEVKHVEVPSEISFHNTCTPVVSHQLNSSGMYNINNTAQNVNSFISPYELSHTPQPSVLDSEPSTSELYNNHNRKYQNNHSSVPSPYEMSPVIHPTVPESEPITSGAYNNFSRRHQNSHLSMPYGFSAGYPSVSEPTPNISRMYNNGRYQNNYTSVSSSHGSLHAASSLPSYSEAVSTLQSTSRKYNNVFNLPLEKFGLITDAYGMTYPVADPSLCAANLSQPPVSGLPNGCDPSTNDMHNFDRKSQNSHSFISDFNVNGLTNVVEPSNSHLAVSSVPLLSHPTIDSQSGTSGMLRPLLKKTQNSHSLKSDSHGLADTLESLNFQPVVSFHSSVSHPTFDPQPSSSGIQNTITGTENNHFLKSTSYSLVEPSKSYLAINCLSPVISNQSRVINCLSDLISKPLVSGGNRYASFKTQDNSLMSVSPGLASAAQPLSSNCNNSYTNSYINSQSRNQIASTYFPHTSTRQVEGDSPHLRNSFEQPQCLKKFPRQYASSASSETTSSQPLCLKIQSETPDQGPGTAFGAENTSLSSECKRVNVEEPKVRLKTAPETSEVSETSQMSDPMEKDIFECAICLEPVSSRRGISSTLCGHVYCTHCIIEAVKRDRRCPTCRKDLDPSQVHPLFMFGKF